MKFTRYHALALLAAATLVLSGLYVAGRAQAAASAALPGLVRAELQRLTGREVSFQRLQIDGIGVHLTGLVAHRREGEQVDPLTVDGATARADWWQLVTRGTTRINELELRRPVFRSAGTAAPDLQWTAAASDLARTGIRRIRIIDGRAELNQGKETILLTGINSSFRPGKESFAAQLAIDDLRAGQLRLRKLAVNGAGRPGTFEAPSFRVEALGTLLNGGALFQEEEQLLTLKLKGSQAQIAELGRLVKLPKELGAQGSLDVDLTGSFKQGAPVLAAGNFSLRRTATQDLPLTAAAGRIDWRPARTELRDLRLSGPGVSSRMQLDLETPDPASKPRFRATGDFKSSGDEGVRTLASLLRRDLSQMKLREGLVRFTATGVMADPRQTSAAGEFTASDLQLPGVQEGRLALDQVSSRYDLTPDGIQLNRLSARAGGARLAGDARLTHSGDLTGRLTLDAADFEAMRRATSGLSLWTWLPSRQPGARLRVTADLRGNIGDPEAVRAKGAFSAVSLRMASATPLPGDVVLVVPVHRLEGTYAMAGRKLHLNSVTVAASSFDMEGDLSLDYSKAAPVIEAALDLETENWRNLPAVPPTALEELRSGRFKGSLHLRERVDRLADAAVSGDFVLTDGDLYLRKESAPVRLEEVASSYSWKAGSLNLKGVRLRGGGIEAGASGDITAAPGTDNYILRLDLAAQTADAGSLARELLGEALATGGAARLRGALEMPVRDTTAGRFAGNLMIEDTTIRHDLELLGRPTSRVKSLDVDFVRSGDSWELPRIEAAADQFTARLRGAYAGERLVAEGRVSSDSLKLPAELPLSGGSWVWNGSLVAQNGANPLLSGTLSGKDVRFALNRRNLQAAGTVDLVLAGQGDPSDTDAWIRSARLREARGVVTAGERKLAIRELEADLSAADGGWNVGRFSLQSGVAQLRGKGRLAETGWQASLDRSSLELEELGTLLKMPLPRGSVAVAGAELRGDTSGILSGSARLSSGKLVLQPGWLKDLPVRTLDSARADLEWAGQDMILKSLTARAASTSLQASGTLKEGELQIEGMLQGQDARLLQAVVPKGVAAGPWNLKGRIGGRGKIYAGAADFKVADVVVPLAGENQHLKLVEGSISGDSSRVKLDRIRAEGEPGLLEGSGFWSPRLYRLELAASRIDGKLIQRMIPGLAEVGPGSSATLVMSGSGKERRPSFGGRMSLAKARYIAPAEFGLRDVPLFVTAASADYQFTPAGLAVRDIRVDTPVLQASGHADYNGRLVQVVLNMKTSDVGALSKYLPLVQMEIAGGEGTGVLTGSAGKAGFTGTLKVAGQGGEIRMENVPAEYAVHPIETASALIKINPGTVSITDAKLRGPVGNLDGQMVWRNEGPVSGGGKAWFSKEYSKKLIKPTGWGWLASLVGVRQIKSDFTIGGTSSEVMLDAAITRSLMWKVAKSRVPPQFQKIAAGKTPLWVAPVGPATVAKAAPAPPAREDVAPVTPLPAEEKGEE